MQQFQPFQLINPNKAAAEPAMPGIVTGCVPTPKPTARPTSKKPGRGTMITVTATVMRSTDAGGKGIKPGAEQNNNRKLLLRMR